MIGREYQQDHIDSIIRSLSKNRSVCAQQPTGGGKTVEFALISQRYIKNTDKSVLIIVHREELLHQASRTITSITGIHPFLITANTKRVYKARIYIAMVDSLTSRLDMVDNLGLVIIDECHIANFNKIHSIYLTEFIIGFSATPLSSSKKEPLQKYYKDIIPGLQIKELISRGFLSQNITRCPKNIVDTSSLSINKMKGDFDEGKMATEYKKPKFVRNVIRMYKKHCEGLKTVIFNVNVSHSIEVTEMLVIFGYNCRHLDAGSSKKPSCRPGFKNEREEILDWFKNTDNAIMCNVMIATVGFDEPTIRAVMLNFSTLSLPKFIQCAGRGGRTIDQVLADQLGCETKDYFNLIDLGGNCLKFGDWNDDRDWRFVFENPDKPGNGVAPVKSCPECDGILHASARVCNLHNEKGEVCGYEFATKEVGKEENIDDLILFTKNIDIQSLVQQNSSKFDYYTFLQLGNIVVEELYTEFPEPTDNQKQRAFEHYYELCKDWYNKEMAGKDGNKPNIDKSRWHINRATWNFQKLVQNKEKQKQNILEKNQLI